MSDDNQSPLEHSVRPFRGRFMDMVHPSSDVKVAAKANYASNRQSDNQAESAEESDSIFEPVAFAEPAETEPIDVKPKEAAPDQPEDTHDTDASDESDRTDGEPLKSPFLPGVKVDKRPLGAAEPDVLPDWLQRGLDELSEPELSAGDDAEELELPAEVPSEPIIESEPEPPKSRVVELSTNQSLDARAALENTMIQPQYKTSADNEIARPSSPYAYATHDDVAVKAKTRKHVPVWTWVIIYVLLILAGAAIGALIYLSGWLG